MLSPRLKAPVTVILLAAFVALGISFTFTAMRYPLSAGFLDHWIRNFLIAAAVGVPVALLTGPIAEKVAGWICR